MRSLRGVGVLFSLLIVGVLGGMMAPLPSEAQTAPSLTLKVDGGATTELIQTTPATANAACTSSEKSPGGFNLCYRLKTGVNSYAAGNTGRTYQVTGASTATLNVADTDGGLQKFKVSTLRISPTATNWGCSNAARTSNCANALETHTIVLTLTLPFEFVSDVNTTMQGMLLTEGTFYPIPATVPLGQIAYTVRNNAIELTGYGRFNSGDGVGNIGRPMTGDTSTGKFYSRRTGGVNTTGLRGPMRFQYGGTATTSQYYSLAQTQADYDSNGATSPTYPIYTNCTNPSFSNRCAPTITAIYTVTVYGPDTIELQTSNDLFFGGCDITNNKGGQVPKGPPCFSSGKKKGFNDTLTSASQASTDANTTTAQANGATAGEQCVEDCPCAFEECQGTIVIAMRHSNNVTTPLAFPFAATGPDIALSPDPAVNFLVTTSNGTKIGQTRFENLFVGNLTEPWTFRALIESFPPIVGFGGSWKVDNINCESDLNEPAVYDAIGQLITPAVIVSTWTTDSGSDKRTATVTKLGKGDVVTCSYHAHKNSAGN